MSGLKCHGFSPNVMPSLWLLTSKQVESYCWWKKSQTTTWNVWNLVNNGKNYQPQLFSRIFFNRVERYFFQSMATLPIPHEFGTASKKLELWQSEFTFAGNFDRENFDVMKINDR